MQGEKTLYSRAYGMDIRIDKNDDGSLSAYEAFPFSNMYIFALRADRDTIIRRFDVSGSIRRWLAE